ncbi:AraC family transcriptional regulator [Clostridium sartagoforme AAU1]|jgi:AraC family transcriptional regulator|uniref:AraC family transcriptional regulator n=1 Tax=Clostridium sartagoforme AAU1 TaxID=1202534 RepID=R9BVV8_9CLOT|nr:AraC family transcriptional regulator [Clostridium sartagoforme]EOR21177.1 AraC family transcriptional regulator [Clostridium sartagoforme AAU1]
MLHELNHVIDYIEDHITDDNLSLEIISEYAGVSDYHFRKIFFYLSGLTLNEYIKNRKLSEANKDLLNGEKVTDVALKYGYQSMDGFTRAFKKWSGFLPSDSIKKGISKSFPKLSFIITVKGGISMEFRIEDKQAFNLVGVSKRVPMQFQGVNNEIVKLAQSITDEQRKEMHSLQNIEPYEIINASYEADANFLKEEGDLTHLIGVLTTENEVSNLLEKVPVKACTWAIFPNEGPFPSTLQETMAKIYSEWLPSSNYELINAPTFSFTKMNEHKKDYAYSEVWIPVTKK